MFVAQPLSSPLDDDDDPYGMRMISVPPPTPPRKTFSSVLFGFFSIGIDYIICGIVAFLCNVIIKKSYEGEEVRGV